MENSLVVKANDLIQARYELNLLEQKIILYAVAQLDRTAENFNVISFSVSEFTELIGTTADRYVELREVVSKLMSKQVRIKTTGRDLVANWVSSIDYLEGEGTVEIEFSVKLVPYLLQLKNRFTRYRLKNILHLKNKYSIRIYELLKQYENLETRQFELEDLKGLLMLGDKYPAFKDFNKWILKPTMEEINEYTDINIDYEKVKKGKTVVGIRYIIESKDTAEKQYVEYLEKTYNIPQLKAMMGLEKDNFSSKQVMELYSIAVDKAGEKVDVFAYAKLNYQYMVKNGKARNKFGYMKKALEDDYAKAYIQLKMNYIV